MVYLSVPYYGSSFLTPKALQVLRDRRVINFQPHGQYLWLQDAQGESLISVVEQLEQQVHEERFRHWRAKQRLEEEVALRKGLEARLAAVEAELARLRG